MNTDMKIAIHVIEGSLGYNAIGYVPEFPVLKKYTHAVLGLAVAGTGYMVKGEAGNHLMAVGIGATIGGLLDAFGFRR
ncbi:MAG: hypothetical protein AABX93_02180 [Nanoarchaeota archaeon]